MATKTFSFTKFDGGLNTATDPSMLPPNMTPAMLNCDILLTGGITRRHGYVPTNENSLGAYPVKAITRTRDCLLAVCGTAIWSQPADTQPWTAVHASSVYQSGTYEQVDGADYSGGVAYGISGTAEFLIPKSTSVRVLLGPGSKTIKCEGTTLTGTSVEDYTFGSLSATHHHVYIEPATVTGSQSQSWRGGYPLGGGAYWMNSTPSSTTTSIRVRSRGIVGVTWRSGTTWYPAGPPMGQLCDTGDNEWHTVTGTYSNVDAISFKFDPSYRVFVDGIWSDSTELDVTGTSDGGWWFYETGADQVVAEQTTTLSPMSHFHEPAEYQIGQTFKVGTSTDTQWVVKNFQAIIQNPAESSKTVTAVLMTLSGTELASANVTMTRETASLRTFSFPSVRIPGGTTYRVGLKGIGSGGSTTFYTNRNSAGGYADGSEQSYSGGVWSDTTGMDLRFTVVAQAMEVDVGVADVNHNSIDVASFLHIDGATWVHRGSVTGTQFGFATYDGVTYVNSESMDLHKCTVTGTFSDVSGTTPKGGFLVEYQDRLFTSGALTGTAVVTGTDVPNSGMVEVTDVGRVEGSSWVNGEAFRVAPPNAQADCTGLTIWDSKLWFTTKDRLYSCEVSGPAETWSALAYPVTGFGCVAPKTFAVAPNGVIMLCADKSVRTYGLIKGIGADDGSGLENLSLLIQPTLDSISASMLPKAAAAFYKNKYWLACALNGDTTNNTVLVYDLDKKAWAQYSNLSIGVFYVSTDDEYVLYGGSATTGDVYRLDYGETDDGSVIPMSYTLPPVPIGGYETAKVFRQIHLAADSPTPQDVTIAPTTDDVPGVTQTVSIGPANDVQPARVRVQARGRYMQTTISASGADAPLTINKVTYTYIQNPVR